jgi:hypothetical protein
MHDLANASLKRQTACSPHRLDTISETPIPDEPAFPTRVDIALYLNVLPEDSNVPVVYQEQ